MGNSPSQQSREKHSSQPSTPTPSSSTTLPFTPIDSTLWQSKEGAKFCTLCLTPFKKHTKYNCRKCGHIICISCAENYHPNKDSILCKTCYRTCLNSVELSKADIVVKEEKAKSSPQATVASQPATNASQPSSSPPVKAVSNDKESAKLKASDDREVNLKVSKGDREELDRDRKDDREFNTKASKGEGLDRDREELDRDRDTRSNVGTSSSSKVSSPPSSPALLASSSRANNVPSPSKQNSTSASVRDQLATKEAEARELSESMKRITDIVPLIKDCKLKFQQIKKKEASIDEFAKEEGTDDILKDLREDKNKCAQIITQNKKKIADIDKAGLFTRRLLGNVEDCEDSVNFAEAQYKTLSSKYDACSKEVTQLQNQVKSASPAYSGDQYISDFNSQFNGEWVHQISLDKFISYDGYMKYRIDGSDKTAITRYLGAMKDSVDYVQLVYSSSQQRLFHGAIETLEKRAVSGLFSANLGVESNPEERQKVLDALVTAPFITKHNREGITIVGAFHGTTAAKAESILQMGFANLATLDDGWFGNGVYFTSSPDYAYRYCKNKKDPCLIFCFLILANPYPVIYADAPSSSDLKFKGKSNYRNYGCHYVPVVHYKGADFRPPNPAVDHTGDRFDEIVIFQETHILPFGVVHLKE